MTQKITKQIETNLQAICPVITNLSREGRTLSDIGMIIGYTGKDAKEWMKRLKRKYPDIEKAWEAGRDLADTQLVIKAYQRAVGYEYIETEEEWKETDKLGNKLPNPICTSKTVKKKNRAPDVSMLKFLLINRLPEYFQDIKQVSIRRAKPTDSIDKGTLKNFAERLLTANIIDVEVEPKTETVNENS
jgi:hypothetical protein